MASSPGGGGEDPRLSSTGPLLQSSGNEVAATGQGGRETLQFQELKGDSPAGAG